MVFGVGLGSDSVFGVGNGTGDGVVALVVFEHVLLAPTDWIVHTDSESIIDSDSDKGSPLSFALFSSLGFRVCWSGFCNAYHHSMGWLYAAGVTSVRNAGNSEGGNRGNPDVSLNRASLSFNSPLKHKKPDSI